MFLQGWTELGISFRYLKIKFQKLLGVAHFAKMRHQEVPYAWRILPKCDSIFHAPVIQFFMP